MPYRVTLSIVMPVFNHADLVIEMLRSIQDNTFQDWEVVAVDDGSEQSAWVAISEYCKSDERIRYIHRDDASQKGAQTCRNIGLELANGEFVCFFDSDDFIAPHGLAQRVKVIREHEELDFMVFPSATYKEGRFSTAPSANVYGYPLFKDDIAAFCQRRLPFIVWNNIYRRASLLEKGITWDVNLRSLQDAQFNLQCLLAGMKYEYATLPPDYAYRYGVAGSISKKINSAEHLESNLYTINYFYEAVQGVFTHKYDSALYRGAAQVYLTILRNEVPKWFSQRLVALVKGKSPMWGWILSLQVSMAMLLGKILPAKVSRAIPFCFNIMSNRFFMRKWKIQAISKFVMAYFLVLLSLSSCAQKTDSRDHLYELSWSDEFNTSTLDTTLWSKMKRVKNSRCSMYFTSDERLFEQKKGRLRLFALHNENLIPTDTAQYLTGGITSDGKATFEYGKIEVRAKVKGAQGTWPAIWTLPIESKYRTVKSPYYAELDIMEYVDRNTFAYQTAHNEYTLRDRKNWTRPNHQVKSPVKVDKYNVYSVEILPDEIIFAVNGIETLRYPRLEEEAHQFHYGLESFLMLDMQVNPPKSWSKGVDSTTFPAYMDIDWVRVYKLKDNALK